MIVNQKFAEHTTSVAFHLSLSRSQIMTLCQIRAFQQMRDKGDPFDVFAFFSFYGAQTRRALGIHADTYIASLRALEARGLVEDGPKVKLAGFSESEWPALTEAGETVFRLLEIAGLIARLEAAQQQVA